MAILQFDIADSQLHLGPPRHGWALNSQGVKLLWLPVLGALQAAYEGLQTSTGSCLLALRGIDYVRAGFQKLVLCLREVGAVERAVAALRWDDDAAILALHGVPAAELVPLYVDTFFLLLRVLADDLAFALGETLFPHPGAAPQDMKGLVRAISRLRASTTAGYDVEAVSSAVALHLEWFGELTREPDATGKKGIRAAIAHRRTVTQVQFVAAADGPFQIEVRLASHQRDVGHSAELLTVIRAVLKDFCAFLDGVYTTFGFAGIVGYGWGSTISAVGNDADIVTFWPPVTAPVPHP